MKYIGLQAYISLQVVIYMRVFIFYCINTVSVPPLVCGVFSVKWEERYLSNCTLFVNDIQCVFKEWWFFPV